jgi:hypothetical protein
VGGGPSRLANSAPNNRAGQPIRADAAADPLCNLFEDRRDTARIQDSADLAAFYEPLAGTAIVAPAAMARAKRRVAPDLSDFTFSIMANLPKVMV